MAKNDLYDGMEILHLEDFSNKYKLEENFPGTPIQSNSYGTQQKIHSWKTQDSIGFLGDYAAIISGSPTGTSSLSGTAGAGGSYFSLMFDPRISVNDGSELMLGVRSRRSPGNFLFHSSTQGYATACFRVGIEFSIPSEDQTKRTIVSFDYRPVDSPLLGTYTSSIIPISKMVISNRNTLDTVRFNMTGFERVPFVESHLSGKIEFIFENSRLKTYFRNRLLSDVPWAISSDGTYKVYFGEVLGIDSDSTAVRVRASDIPNMGTPFAISNLAIVRVPIESPVNRLRKFRVERSLANSLDGVIQDSDSPLNGEVTDDGNSYELDDHDIFVKFAPITLKQGESIIGTQTVVSYQGTDVTKKLITELWNGTTKLGENEYPLPTTHRTRNVVSDSILGNDPSNYTGLELRVRTSDKD